VRLWHTPTLRQYDAGVMMIGYPVDPQQLFVPPGVLSTVTGYCHSDCTSQGISEDGVSVFANLLHAHTVGSALTLRHIRDGVELEPLDVNDHYDFDYQQTTAFEEYATLLPGDQLIMHCTYDTTEKEDMVLSGEATSEEMCLSYVFVYPVPDTTSCWTGFSDNAVSQWLDDAYNAGYWDVNIPWNDTVLNIADLIEEGYLDTAGNMSMYEWEEWNGYWNHEMEGAADFYELFWNDSKYSERLSVCYNYESGFHSESLTNYDVEFGDFEEYCTDSCGCEDGEEDIMFSTMVAEESSESSDDGAIETWLIILIAVIGVMALIAVIIIFVVLLRKKEPPSQPPTNQLMTTPEMAQNVQMAGDGTATA